MCKNCSLFSTVSVEIERERDRGSECDFVCFHFTVCISYMSLALGQGVVVVDLK